MVKQQSHYSLQVLQAMICGSLGERQGVERAVRYRVQEYRTFMRQDMGAYSDSRGYEFIRENVKNYLNERDNTDNS